MSGNNGMSHSQLTPVVCVSAAVYVSGITVALQAPEMRAPIRGPYGPRSLRSLARLVRSLFPQRRRVMGVDRVEVAEDGQHDRERNGRFGGGEDDDEESKHLPG